MGRDHKNIVNKGRYSRADALRPTIIASRCWRKTKDGISILFIDGRRAIYQTTPDGRIRVLRSSLLMTAAEMAAVQT